MRLARQLGWFNVDAMLATGQPGQLDEWIAFEQLEPIGDDWERTSLETTSIVNALQLLTASLSGSKDPPEPLEWDELVKYRNKSEQKRRKQIRGALDALEAMEGL